MKTPPFKPNQQVRLIQVNENIPRVPNSIHLVINCYWEQNRWWLHTIGQSGEESHLLAFRFQLLSNIRRP